MSRHGFTLLEILLSLLLCALLSLSVAAAVATAARADALATARAAAVPLLETLYAAHRLDPAAPLPPLPPGWRCDADPASIPAPPGAPLCPATRLTLRAPANALPPVALRIYRFPEPDRETPNPKGNTP